MRPKSLLLLALALGCGLIASIGISQVMDRSGPTTAGYETEQIYVALHNINLNDPIDETMVALQEWPKDKVPKGAITKQEDLIHRRSRTSIIQGEPILEAKLLAEGEVYDPIGAIPPGMRLKTISVDAEKSAAGLLSPGDRVDVQLFVERNEQRGFPDSRTKVILQNIRIYAVDQTVQRKSDEEGRTIAKTVSLLLEPAQANKVALAEQIGELNLIPRSPGDEALSTDTELKVSDLFADADVRNTREREQMREPEETAGSGFLRGLMNSVQQSANDKPPFVMTILEAEEMREVTFDPVTGKPIHDTKSESDSRSIPAQPTSLPTPAPAEDPEMEKAAEELGIDFPIELEDE